MSTNRPSGRRPPSGGGGSPILTPRIAVRIAVLGGLAVALLGILVVRLWFLQVIGSEEYTARAEGNRLRTVITEPPRGKLLDRTGDVLVTNRDGVNLVARPRELFGPRRTRVLSQLSPKLGVPVKELEARMAAGEGTPFQSVVLAENVDPQLEDYLAERRRQFPGMGLRNTYERTYPRGKLASQVLGTTGRITADQLKAYRDRGYVGNETVGQSGIESQYEDWLRGTPGRVEVEVDNTGEPVGRGVVSEVAPKPGENVELTIDRRTQEALQRALAEQTAITGRGAAGVALDPRTGEVLAMASKPDYDPDVFVTRDPERIAALNTDPRQPQLNRAVGGAYPAGSTFKVVSASAALRHGYVSPDQYLSDEAQITLYKQEFHNFRFESRGSVNLTTAIEVSSDVYFFQLGDKFYQAAGSPLQDEAFRFGFGKPTGIDLPGEVGGLVPTQEWKKEAFPPPEYSDFDRDFRPGEIIQMAVGQGDLQVTPLQLASAYSALAEDGVWRTPSLGRRVLDPAGNVLRQLSAGKPTRSLEVGESYLASVKQGLYEAANGTDGTSVGVFGGLPEQYKVAGKTGTAEQVGGEDHSWFVGYAPYDDPRIVVAVVVERGGTGANAAAPAVCDTIAAGLRFSPDLCGAVAEAN